MSEYTPDTGRVRAACVEVAPITGAEFDRWVAAHDAVVEREAAARALEEAAERWPDEMGRWDGYAENWLRARASEIRQEGKTDD